MNLANLSCTASGDHRDCGKEYYSSLVVKFYEAETSHAFHVPSLSDRTKHEDPKGNFCLRGREEYEFTGWKERVTDVPYVQMFSPMCGRKATWLMLHRNTVLTQRTGLMMDGVWVCDRKGQTPVSQKQSSSKKKQRVAWVACPQIAKPQLFGQM